MSSLAHFLPLLGQALPKAPAVPALPWYQEAWFNVIMALLVLILPFVIGSWLVAPDANERLCLAHSGC